MSLLLKWSPRVLGDGQRVYRSGTPFAPDALPAAIATLGAGVGEFLDESPLTGENYYRIETYAGSPEVSVISDMVVVRATGSQVGAPVSPIPSRRYWRIRVLENRSWGSTPAISAAEIELREVSGGPDMTGSGVASGDTTSFGTPDNLFDGDPNSIWVSHNLNYGSHWISYDFGVGNAVAVGEIVWSKRPDHWGQQEAPTYFEVDCSDDGLTWDKVWAVTTPATWVVGAETRTFTHPALADPTKRHWRVRVLENQSGGSTPAISAAEIELRQVSGGSDLTGSGVVSVDSTSEGMADYLFDGDPNTVWVTPNNNYGKHWIGYDFGAGISREVGAISWSKRPDHYGQQEAVTHGQVEYSSDGIAWAIDWEFTTPATWVVGAETREFVKP